MNQPVTEHENFSMYSDSIVIIELKVICVLLLSVCIIFSSNLSSATEFFISPRGNDANDGRTKIHPFKSFKYTFSKMEAGDQLTMLDGLYAVSSGTGGIHWDVDKYPGSGQIPSGIRKQEPSIIKALNPGNVFVEVPLFIGRKNRKDSFIRVEGITFAGGHLYNTSYIDIKDTGFSDQLTVGTNDHDKGNSYNLIEDVWVWAAQRRIIAINYRANSNVWRRVLIRGDGCKKRVCKGRGNPNVGFTVYDSSDVSVQNMIVIDRILGGGQNYADFASAQHTKAGHFLGRNEWLGVMSINSEDNGIYLEADNVVKNEPTWVLKNAVILGAMGGGINIGNLPNNGVTSNLIENSMVILSRLSKGDGIRVAPGQVETRILNCIVVNAGRYSVNSAGKSSGIISYRPGKSHYNQLSCDDRCYSMVYGPMLKRHISSFLSMLNNLETGLMDLLTPENWKDIATNINYRYGLDGSRFGERGYNTLSTNALWPWPNEKRILNEICATRESGVCNRPLGDTVATIRGYIKSLINQNDLL